MTRPPNPRRGSENRLELARPIKPSVDTAALTELRDALAGLAQRIVDPREEVRALSEGLARQAAMLEQLASLQAKATSLQRETGRQLAQLRDSLVVAPATGPWHRIRSVIQVGWSRLRPNGVTAIPSLTGESQPVRRPNWILADAPDGGERRAVMIVVFGLSLDERQAVVRRLGQGPAVAGIVPVYITDCTEFEPFRDAHAYFEHLPLRRGGRAAAGKRDSALYAARRFQLLCDKWKPIRIVGFGPVAAGWLATEAEATRLPEAVRALIAATDDDSVSAPVPRVAQLDV